MDHEEIIKEQDEQLQEINLNIRHIKQNSRLISEKIHEQEVYIQEMNKGMEKTQQKMGKAMKKIADILQVQSTGQLKLFFSLLCVAIFMFFMLILF